MTVQDIRVPDIGDFKNVAIIEVHGAPGAQLKIEDPLITLESDKASLEVPSPLAGTLIEMKVKVGDKVSKGDLIATMEVGAGSATSATVPVQAKAEAPKAASATPPPAPAAAHHGAADVTCDVVVIGAGPGGYSAAFRAADLGKNVVLIERYATLGGVCLNVGCIPSKALLHTAAVMDEVKTMAAHGISFTAPEIDLGKLRTHKEKVVGKLTGGLAQMAKARKVNVLRGVASFIDPNHLAVAAEDGARQVVRFEKAIIAAGSEAVKLPFLPEDPRIVTSTGALTLPFIPKSMLVIGGGIIGLEMATVYSTLGARVDVVELLDGLMQGADRDLVRVWEKKNAHRFDRIMLKTKCTGGQAKADGIHITFEGEGAPAQPQRYDLVLVAVGRTPNGRKLAAEKAGVVVDERGFIRVDKQMRTNVSHIGAIGDIVGQPMLAHKAVHEGHVAAEVAVGQKSVFEPRQIPSVAYTDPEIAWAGVTEDECKAQGIKYTKSMFPWAALGRAIANGRDEGFTKLLFDAETHRVIGGGIVGTNAGDLIGEVCLAIEMGSDAADIGHTIHPHPTLGESIGMAAEVAEGTCTDLMPAKTK